MKPEMTIGANYCDSCTNAAWDEVGFEPEDWEIMVMLEEMGGDIADHSCDSTESGEFCGCACRWAAG